MATYCRGLLRTVLSTLLAISFAAPVQATSWGPREDVGVAAVDTRTGKVLWEAWRLEEVLAGASNEEKTAVEYLLALTRDSRKPLPKVTPLPDADVKGLEIKNPWPESKAGGGVGSAGKSLIYYRHPEGVIALDKQTKKEAWRLLTTRYPYESSVLEVGNNLVLVQIGSDVSPTIQTALIGGGRLPMRGLEPHTLKQRVAAAMLLHHYGDGHLRPDVQKLIEQLRAEKTDPAAAVAVKALEKLLSNWPKVRDQQRLQNGCIASLLGADEGNPLRELAWPGAQRLVVWSLLQECIYGRPRDAYSRQGYNYAYEPWDERSVKLTNATQTKIADHCRKVVAGGPDAEKPFAVSLLVSTAIGWSGLTDAERKKLFLSANPSAWRWAALALAKNGRRKELMEWSAERGVEDQLDIIWLLNHDKPKVWSKEELAFWVAAAHHHAGGVAIALRRSDGAVPVAFREPIRAYLKREIEKPTIKDGSTNASSRLYEALLVLAAFNDPDDTALFQEYLKHPMQHTQFRSNGGTPWTEFRVYQIRDLARGLLIKRGAKIPPGIVYEEVVPARK